MDKDNLGGKVNGPVSQPKQTPMAPPKPVLVGTKMSILLRFGDNTPFVMGEHTVTGDPQKDIFMFPPLQIQYDGATMQIVNPNDPSQVLHIGVRKSSSIKKVPAEAIQGEKSSFKGQVKKLRKQN